MLMERAPETEAKGLSLSVRQVVSAGTALTTCARLHPVALALWNCWALHHMHPLPVAPVPGSVWQSLDLENRARKTLDPCLNVIPIPAIVGFGVTVGPVTALGLEFMGCTPERPLRPQPLAHPETPKPLNVKECALCLKSS